MKSKGANDNGLQQIIYLMLGMASGLKILVSAVQSRPCPPLFSGSCPSPIFLRREFVTGFVTNSGTLQGIPAHGVGPGNNQGLKEEKGRRNFLVSLAIVMRLVERPFS